MTARQARNTRTARLIAETVSKLRLDLTGLAILTEAGSNAFAVTPAIAAAGGARRVVAVSRDSRFGPAEDARRQAREVAAECGVEDRIMFVGELSADVVGECDIVTNLGFVRPIDATVVAWMKAAAVVPLMCEAWEVRAADVDLAACRERGIAVAGTDEHQDEMPVFAYSGIVAARMLLDAGFEVRGTRVALLGWDKFAAVIAPVLTGLGASLRMAETRTREASRKAVRDADVVLIADYTADDVVVGSTGLLTADDIAEAAPGAIVVQFAGGVDAEELARAGISTWPLPPVPPRRMARTLADLGVRPVIELHAAGLKVGELLARERLAGAGADDAVRRAARRSALVQPVATRAGGVG